MIGCPRLNIRGGTQSGDVLMKLRRPSSNPLMGRHLGRTRVNFVVYIRNIANVCDLG